MFVFALAGTGTYLRVMLNMKYICVYVCVCECVRVWVFLCVSCYREWVDVGVFLSLSKPLSRLGIIVACTKDLFKLWYRNILTVLQYHIGDTFCI